MCPLKLFISDKSICLTSLKFYYFNLKIRFPSQDHLCYNSCSHFLVLAKIWTLHLNVKQDCNLTVQYKMSFSIAMWLKVGLVTLWQWVLVISGMGKAFPTERANFFTSKFEILLEQMVLLILEVSLFCPFQTQIIRVTFLRSTGFLS